LSADAQQLIEVNDVALAIPIPNGLDRASLSAILRCSITGDPGGMNDQTTFELRRSADGAVVFARCLLASTPKLRMRGLLGRDSLERDEGILLKPASSVHTFFMRFPIDVVFLDRDRRVVRIARDVGPSRFTRGPGSKEVLELRAGRADEVGLRVGDELVT
jgi:uncharacterized membrane protein (UPF0127 family)